MRVLPPGQYIVRAKLASGGTPIGDLRREFVVMEATHGHGHRNRSRHGRSKQSATPCTAPALTARALGAVPPFALDQVLAPAVLGPFLERVAARPDAAGARRPRR